MRLSRFSLALVVAVGLHGLVACKKDDSEEEGLSYVNGLPYYHFTEGDRLWLQAKQGDEWKFENGAGLRRTYRISGRTQLQAECKVSVPGFLSDSYRLVSYHDAAEVSVFNTDAASADSGGKFRFYRDATVTAHNQAGSGPSRFYASGYWYSFLGTHNVQTDYYTPGSTPLNGPWVLFTVRGMPYSEVVLFSATPRSSNEPPPATSSISTIYFDRQAGIVRLVSLAGEVWDRVP